MGNMGMVAHYFTSKVREMLKVALSNNEASAERPYAPLVSPDCNRLARIIKQACRKRSSVCKSRG
jgi:hypothetical protein